MDASPSPPPRSFWKRRIVDPIVAQLTQGVTPEKIAITLAVGSALALFPILGSTTLLCFLVGIALKLNQPIVQTINQALWPAQIPSIFFCIRLGERLFRTPPVSLNLRAMTQLFWDHPAQFLSQFGATALHAVAAWLLLAPFATIILYFAVRPLVRAAARLRVGRAPKSSTQP